MIEGLLSLREMTNIWMRGFMATARNMALANPRTLSSLHLMRDVSDNRAVWLARHVLPHEAALRTWLYHRRVAGLDVDDVVQETYAKLAALDTVEGILEPRRYVFQTAYSIILGHVRRSRIVSISAAADLDYFGIPAPEASPEQNLIYRDELNGLATALASLPKSCREAFILRRVYGLSQRETAGKLGISEKTVEKYMARGVRLLMDVFGRGGKTSSQASRALKQRTHRNDERKIIEPGG